MRASSESNVLDNRMPKNVDSAIPKHKQSVINWYGWGYKDTRFSVKNKTICFQGEKYPLHGYMLPHFTAWVKQKFDLEVNENFVIPQMPKTFPEATIEPFLIEALLSNEIEYSDNGEDRFIRCHGQTLHDIYYLWHNKYKRIPDLVVWPKCHKDVETLISLANNLDIVVLPFGGGTSVSGSVTCPQEEPRTIMILDTSQMNRMLWLDKENLTVCFEAGIVGQDLERELQNIGLTVGHEPDSYEFSTLGGWVATRASGMKKNIYGNIEDLIVRVKMVTTKGVLERECSAPRISCGPDFNHLILGSEGTLGVVTEVVLKVRPLPPVKKYGSLVFPDFESGIKFMREIAKRRCQPASVRLMDNEQFRFGQSLKVDGSWFATVMDVLKRSYVSRVKGLNLEKICAATLLFEGEDEDVRRQENVIYDVAHKFDGLPAGSQNGERGYILTFVIAYIRDFALSHEIVAESFETSVPWDRCATLCKNVKLKVQNQCTKHGIKHFLISCRVTQTYDAGCCVYFYFGFRYSGLSNPVEIYEQIENSAREEILLSGGSISHHHGVGKIRSKWYKKTISGAGVALYKAAKKELDPKNIFAINNLLPVEEARCKL